MIRIYNYYCKDHKTFEAYAEQDMRDTPRKCPQCDNLSPYVVGTPRISLDGTDEAFPSAYRTWGIKHEKEAARANKREDFFVP